MTTVAAGWGQSPRRTSATKVHVARTIQSMAPHSFAGTVRAPDFPAGLDWINVARPLHIADLRGRLAIIDFWTFC
jgi:hypothetical protein